MMATITLGSGKTGFFTSNITPEQGRLGFFRALGNYGPGEKICSETEIVVMSDPYFCLDFTSKAGLHALIKNLIALERRMSASK